MTTWTLVKLPDRSGAWEDRQYGTSLGDRYTFGWASSTLKRAKPQARLNLEDVPMLHHSFSSAYLYTRLRSTLEENNNIPLWRIIFVAHRSTFLLQYTISMVQSAAQLAPQVAIGLDRDTEPLDDVVSTRYTNSSRTVSVDLCIVDAKKDIKMTPIQQPDRSPSPVNNRPAGSTPLNSHSSGESQWSHDVRRELKGMAPLQYVSPVNLLGVDAKRLVDFVGASHLLPSFICKLGLSVSVLCALIGWKSMVAGIATLVFITPLNLHLSRLMNRVQSNITQVRD
ncbi:MAG: hypothetical protein Q9186_000184 [Xanthomendoza sp. 1 TL-2023]